MMSALAPWMGSNRILAPRVGEALAGCSWVGVPFMGGGAELFHIKARTIVANDLHRHVINLARVTRDDTLRLQLIRAATRRFFHPDELVEAQEFCRGHEPGDVPDLACAVNYFVACWMGRSGKAGIDDEFNGRVALRWNAGGGDSAVRYLGAIRMLVAFGRIARRCTFECMDACDFIDRCEDKQGHGIYIDPPFPGAGRRYRHNAGQTEAEEALWHERLCASLSRFRSTRIVCRFYDHPLIRSLYRETEWDWRFLAGRKQSNASAPEVLLVSQRAA